MPAVILVQVWKLYPVMFIVLLAAHCRTCRRELREAATIDGANARQRFWHVILARSSPPTSLDHHPAGVHLDLPEPSTSSIC